MGLFNGHYTDWRKTRICKLLSLFGWEYFDGKTLLELGCGHGDIGMFFRSLGAEVTLADGRAAHTDEIRRRYGDVDVRIIDQNCYWDFPVRFDIVLHMGVLYHLHGWQKDLERVFRYTNLLVLETEVANRSSPDFSMVVPEKCEGDQAMYGDTFRVSAANIEGELRRIGATFVRYDDADLNSGCHRYDWEVDDTGPAWKPAAFRRFWIARKECA